MTETYKIIGMLGSFVISSSLVPQMHKVYRTKSAKDISYTFQTLYITGLSMILLYGFGEALWPIYIPACIEILVAIGLLAMKIYYDRRADKAAQQSGSHEIDVASAVVLESSAAKRYSAAHTP